MSNIFEKILHGIEDVGKFIVDVPKKLPLVIKVVDDVKQDGSTVIPETTQIVADVEKIVTTGGKDAVAFLSASKILWPAIIAAIAAEGVNITLDLAVVAQIKPLITDGQAFTNTIPLFEQLFSDFETFSTSLKADLAQLETDAAALV